MVTFGGLTVNGNSDFNGNINFTGELLKNGELYESGAFKKNDNGEAYFESSNVGIGTTDPGHKLDVLGKSQITFSEGAQQLTIKNSSTTESHPTEIYFNRTALGSAQHSAVGHGGTSRDFFIWVNGSDRLNITDSGNVGVGTNDPSAKLEVNGDVKASSLLVMDHN